MQYEDWKNVLETACFLFFFREKSRCFIFQLTILGYSNNNIYHLETPD